MASAKRDQGNGNVEPLNFFAALPGRVISDRRLTALHFRILAAVAGFDRMGRNGRCCFAGYKTLAANIGCAEGSFRNAVSELITMGYLRVERSEDDARRVGYAVVYISGQDAAGIGAKSKTNVSSPDDRNARRNVSSIDDRSRRNASSIDDRKQRDMSSDDDVSAHSKSMKNKVSQAVNAASRKPNIFCETENIRRETHEKLAIGEMWLGSGRGLEALPVVEQIPDETWAVLVRLMRANTLTEVQLQVAIAEARQRLAEEKANG